MSGPERGLARNMEELDGGSGRTGVRCVVMKDGFTAERCDRGEFCALEFWPSKAEQVG